MSLATTVFAANVAFWRMPPVVSWAALLLWSDFDLFSFFSFFSFLPFFAFFSFFSFLTVPQG